MIDGKIRIRLEEDRSKKAEFVKKVLDDLPEWFEFEDANLSYAKSTKDLDTYIISKNNFDIGFIIIKENSSSTIEIYCLGILRDFRENGYGRLLVEEVLNFYRNTHSFAQVKTLDEGIDKYYDETIGFYKSLGFVKLETIKEIRGEENPCMIMVKSL